MTLVHFKFSDSYRNPTKGSLAFMPHRRHAANEAEILPKPFTVALDSGVARVDLQPNDESWVWIVTEYFGSDSVSRYYTVPEQDGVIDHTELIEISPSSLPAAYNAVEPVWWATMRQYKNVVSDNLLQSGVAIERAETAVEVAETAVEESQRNQSLSLAYRNESRQHSYDSRDYRDSSREARDKAEEYRDDALYGPNNAADRSEEARDESRIARDESVTAQQASEAARDESQSARDDSQTARDESVTARDESRTARDESVTAQQASEAARDEATTGPNNAADRAETAQEYSETARDETITARDETFTARDEAVTARSESVAARDETLPAHAESLTARDETIAARDLVLPARDETLTARDETLQHGITVDTTVGTRVFVGNTMIHGDTGWWDVTGDLINGWLADYLWVRRIGDIVYVLGYGLDGQESTIDTLYLLPSGFRLGATNRSEMGVLRYTSDISNTTPWGVYGGSGGQQLKAISVDRSDLSGSMAFVTTQPWPTSLPGNPL